MNYCSHKGFYVNDGRLSSYYLIIVWQDYMSAWYGLTKCFFRSTFPVLSLAMANDERNDGDDLVADKP